MIYCVRCINMHHAQDLVRRYADKLKPYISEIRKYRAYPCIKLKDGSELHFITHDYYKTWCKGITYKMIFNGKVEEEVYHSGHPVKSSD